MIYVFYTAFKQSSSRYIDHIVCRARLRVGETELLNFLFGVYACVSVSVSLSVDTILSPQLLIQFSRDVNETFQLMFP